MVWLNPWRKVRAVPWAVTLSTIGGRIGAIYYAVSVGRLALFELRHNVSAMVWPNLWRKIRRTLNLRLKVLADQKHTAKASQTDGGKPETS